MCLPTMSFWMMRKICRVRKVNIQTEENLQLYSQKFQCQSYNQNERCLTLLAYGIFGPSEESRVSCKNNDQEKPWFI